MTEEQRREGRTASVEAFLYILLRDHITLGECEAIMIHAKLAAEKGAVFSNQHLCGYLDELMFRLGVKSTDDKTQKI